jgi:hypothetical protein
VKGDAVRIFVSSHREQLGGDASIRDPNPRSTKDCDLVYWTVLVSPVMKLYPCLIEVDGIERPEVRWTCFIRIKIVSSRIDLHQGPGSDRTHSDVCFLVNKKCKTPMQRTRYKSLRPAMSTAA